MKTNLKNLILLIIGVVLLMFLATFLFTRHAFSNLFDYSLTGQIGDTIGGIASPIIGLMGAVLVYLSFREQIEANTIQRDALRNEIKRSDATKDFQALLDIFKQIKEDYSNLEYLNTKGKRALVNFKLDFRKQPKISMKKAFYKDFTFLLEVLNILIERSKSLELNKNDSSLLLKLIILFYNSKLETHVIGLINVCESKQIGLNFMQKLKVLKENIRVVALTN